MITYSIMHPMVISVCLYSSSVCLPLSSTDEVQCVLVSVCLNMFRSWHHVSVSQLVGVGELYHNVPNLRAFYWWDIFSIVEMNMYNIHILYGLVFVVWILYLYPRDELICIITFIIGLDEIYLSSIWMIFYPYYHLFGWIYYIYYYDWFGSICWSIFSYWMMEIWVWMEFILLIIIFIFFIDIWILLEF